MSITSTRTYIPQLCNLLSHISPEQLNEAITILNDARLENKLVLFCGNGGSGSSCSHIVNDFQNGTKLRAICLNDAIPVVSAIANECSWEFVFSHQVEVLGEKGGVLVVLSGSGNSMNVINAIAVARGKGMKVIGLCGFDGGVVKRTPTLAIHIPTFSMQQAEDCHMVILHLLYLGLQEKIEESRIRE